VKRSGRDEPIWVVIHMCMEAMLGISIYVFSSTKLENTRAEQILPGSKEGRGGSSGERWPKQCINI
jgi:hypothetical protein